MRLFGKMLLACIGIAAACIAQPATAQVPAPAVSPDALPDVPPTPAGENPFPFFDNYSWRSFIALNWPAMSGADNRGLPDRSKAFGDTSGPRVWGTWKSRYEIFQPGGSLPSAWTSYDGVNPCGASNQVVTLRSFSAFADFNQAIVSLTNHGNPLVAQNRTYIRYEVRVNRSQFDSIVDNKWYLADNLPTATAPVPFKNGSTEIKAAWRILTDADTAEVRKRYYIVPGAQVLDVSSGQCAARDIALVGFHIVTKTPNRPQWIWSSFEHVDNVPGLSSEPPPPAGIPRSFNNPGQPQALIPEGRPPALSPDNPPASDPSPMQVVRKQPIQSKTMDMNRTYWNLPEIKGTVWQNYMLVMTQWPTQIAPESPTNNGAPFPSSGSTLSNTTMETYFQFDDGTGHCMVCHHLSNRRGRDFVMFVTFDAFRPDLPALGPTIARANTGELRQSRDILISDPLIKSLSDLFEATRDKR
jgi:hypothetical protein